MPPPPPPASDKPRSPVPSQHLNVNNIYGAGLNADHFGSVSQVSLPDGGGQVSDTQKAEGSSEAKMTNAGSDDPK